jgi:ABC-type molybdate transport system substrate-binding protein
VHVTLNPVSEESWVTEVLTKVTSGQADAEAAEKFFDLVTGEAGLKVLSRAGFAKP